MYFDRLLSDLHPSLHNIARDRRLLRHTPEEDLIETLEGLYHPHYTLVPWILDDIFPVPEDERLQVGRAWLPLLIAFVIIDSIMDEQLDHVPTTPLIHQHYMLASSEALRPLFATDEAFWSFYHARLKDMLAALALEDHSVGQGNQPYTWDLMQEVNIGKSAPFAIPIYALAKLSHQPDDYQPVHEAYSKLVLADQLADDAGDWRDDFAAGRLTLATTLAQELGVDFKTAQPPDLDALQRAYVRSGAPAYMLDHTVTLLTEARDILHDHGWQNTRLDDLLTTRIETTRSVQSRFKIARFLFTISHRPEQESEQVSAD